MIVDIHQDGFARTLCYGCGAGFPLWAVSPRTTPHAPNNGCGCKGWPLLELLDPGVYRSFGEFGIPGGTRRAGDYVDYHYDRLDAVLASGMQWTVSPRGAPQAGEGWNGEDFSLLDAAGRPRPNYRPRPYPQRVAGVPAFRFEANAPPRGEPRLEFVWAHVPGLGPTEIVVPEGLFPPGSRPRAEPVDATCLWDDSRRLVTCDAPRRATIRLVLESP